ncbi:hypothetical protein ACLB2K_036426 [Fragaria x ananassa]
MEEESAYLHEAWQRKEPRLRHRFEEDKLFIRLELYKCIVWCRERSGPITKYDEIKIGQKLFRVKFSHFKQQLSENDIDCYARIISVELNKLHVPGYVHRAIAKKIFDVVEAAVSPEDPVVVYVFDSIWRFGDEHDDPSRPNLRDLTHRVGDRHDGPSRPKVIPASRSSILGLEPVTVLDTVTESSCAVCLEDFEQAPFTRLPCTHQFHVHCIVQCLEINHLCPLCRVCHALHATEAAWVLSLDEKQLGRGGQKTLEVGDLEH